jgi:glycosyltransferase involved in cell wall biosynthesis
MLVHSYYDEDSRVRGEAEALVRAGIPVVVLGLRRPGDPAFAMVEGVEIRRLGVQRHQGAGMGIYLREYVSFMCRAGWVATRLARRRRFRLAHVHSLPDFLVFATLPLRLAGTPVLLDLHEAMPEFFRSRFAGRHSLFHRALVIQERASIGYASAVVTVNTALRDRLIDLGVEPMKVTVIPNGPTLKRFDPHAHPRRAFRTDAVLRLIYAGALTPTYELDVAIRAVAEIHRRRPELNTRFDVFGQGDSEMMLRALVAELGLDDRVTFHGRVPIDRIPAAIAAADIGLAPTRRDPFTELSISTKLLEYAAMEKPIVASGLPLVLSTFPPGSIETYESGDASSLANAVERIADDVSGRAAAIEGAREVARRLGWEATAERLVGLIDLIAPER